MSASARTIRIPAVPRVEGEGSVHVTIRDGRVRSVRLGIFEPPRFFEGLLRGRSYEEVPDLVARICGICPVAHQITAARALEDALGITIDPGARAVRRLLYCGEWISSHALHVVLLHAPDFLGYDDGIRMAKDHGARVAAGLELKKLGNALVAVAGGRAIHPVAVRVGGLWSAPAPDRLEALRARLERGLDLAAELVRWVASFEMPAAALDVPLVALVEPGSYPLDAGTIASTEGLTCEAREFDAVSCEKQVPSSNALRSELRGRGPYAAGPLARFALNAEQLGGRAAEAARAAGLSAAERNPFRSIVVRAIEMLWACEEALRCLDAYRAPATLQVPPAPRPSTGYAVTEAPRGLLYHRYRIDAGGRIVDAKIVPPTAQFLSAVEADLERFVGERLSLPKEELTRLCARVVRNYDPCISCATHALRVTWDVS